VINPMTKYLLAAQKIVQDAGVGGGIKTVQKYKPMIDKLAKMARDAGDEDSAQKVESLTEALLTANL
jgi:hypothetical protein